ncbi:hypothetical protein LTR91_018497 [Friedmanniomyces endolithicus]|uniref:Uncharacterized protein n=2 Tax=Dothideomycetidae TaxID=451867 RepID=A0AAN6K4M9_9PEZI|nr:hypothetical protein LTR94_017005 [Friedmanniomyces endolithicus]KAK0775360.1 hypothetical protein LTR59_014558 [Friedmanniomyces endolithicus]KAK0779737.1 hypothetical protein LTR38_014320 [Friedmanniomyces endolithicus]KAK0783798.1 hypothetical protein LTR75_014025 [Friedmanniomyces endolithicus]KAK0836932.1 hypothetical protein LTR03_013220 [Friedmanniomyces endolithicus]
MSRSLRSPSTSRVLSFSPKQHGAPAQTKQQPPTHHTLSQPPHTAPHRMSSNRRSSRARPLEPIRYHDSMSPPTSPLPSNTRFPTLSTMQSPLEEEYDYEITRIAPQCPLHPSGPDHGMPAPAGHTTASSLIFKKAAMLEEMVSVLSSDLEATQQQLLDRRAELLAFNERLDRVAASMAGKKKKKNVAGLSTPLPRTPSLRHDVQSDAAETPLPPTPPEKPWGSWLGSSKILGTGRAEEAQGPCAEKVSSGHPPGTLDPVVADVGLKIPGTDV